MGLSDEVWFWCLKKKVLQSSLSLRSPYLGRATAAARAALPSLQCVSYFHVSKQWYSCQRLGFLTCAHIFLCVQLAGELYEHCHRVCTESWTWEKIPCCTLESNPHRSVLHLAFQSDAVPILNSWPFVWCVCPFSNIQHFCGYIKQLPSLEDKAVKIKRYNHTKKTRDIGEDT